MTHFIKKEVRTGLVIAAVILSICAFLGSDAGPCNAGVGIIIDFFIIVPALLIAAMFMLGRSASISLTALTVLICLGIGSVLFLLYICYI